MTARPPPRGDQRETPGHTASARGSEETSPTVSRQDDRKELGRRGEQWVAEALIARGFTILARNHRSRWGEIDLIAARGDVLWMVEVKTRRGRSFGVAQLSPRQHDRITRMAYRFLQTHPRDFGTVQLVVARVTLVGDRPEIELLQRDIEGTY